MRGWRRGEALLAPIIPRTERGEWMPSLCKPRPFKQWSLSPKPTIGHGCMHPPREKPSETQVQPFPPYPHVHNSRCVPAAPGSKDTTQWPRIQNKT